MKEDYSSQKDWCNNKASTIFPLYVNENNDQVIVFQHYWKWKNDIDDVTLVIRLRNEIGENVGVKEFDIEEHNEISILKEFGLTHEFGMIECEIISTSNIGFPFPALQYFSVNKNKQISCVHSGGRIYNSNEPTVDTKFTETNFLCLFNEDFEPFIHVFSGNYVLPGEDKIDL